MAKTIFEEIGRQIRKARRLFNTVLNCTRRRRTADRHLGQRHLDYLKHHCKVTYTNLLTSGRLNAYLATLTDRHRNALKGS